MMESPGTEGMSTHSRIPAKEKTPKKAVMLKTAWMQATEGMPTMTEGMPTTMKKQQRGCQQQ